MCLRSQACGHSHLTPDEGALICTFAFFLQSLPCIGCSLQKMKAIIETGKINSEGEEICGK